MIISRTPFRISFFGGGTDYPVWYKENKGAVLATTINKYCYITCRYLPPFFGHKYRIVHSLIENVKGASEIKHPAVRACLKYMKIKEGVTIHHDGDLPARSGLGSSSSFTVGLLNTLYALKGIIPTKRQLALDAIHVEQELIKENVGSQDQVMAAFGGFNHVEFGGDHHILVKHITINEEKTEQLHSHTLLFFTGLSRIASDIAHEQINNTHRMKKELTSMHQMVEEAIKIINTNKIKEFGKLLHESWLVKKSLSDKISMPHIDDIYDTARRSGAIGGKLLGAGGGGFMLIFAEPHKHDRIKEKLKKLLYVPFRFENLGSQIIFYQP